MGNVVTKMYEKPTELFLCIPPTSAHSPGVLLKEKYYFWKCPSLLVSKF
jgi:hypothetical protein